MKTMLAALLFLAGFSSVAAAAGPGDQPPGPPDQHQYQGSPQYPPGPPSSRRGGDQIGTFAQLSDLLDANYRIVAGYQGGLVLVRDDRVFVCSYFQLREGGDNYGARLVSQGCSEL